jgi:hypothetical protein
MVIISPPGIQQDTLKTQVRQIHDTVTLHRDSLTLRPDTLHAPDTLQIRKDTVKHLTRSAGNEMKVHITDTTSVCTKTIICDFIFYNKENSISNPALNPVHSFPFWYIDNLQNKKAEEKTSLLTHLHHGEKLPVQVFHNDWIILVIISLAFLYSVVRSSSTRLFSSMADFVLFRSINDKSPRDISGIFTWQSTLLNLVSFTTLGLFFFMVFLFYKIDLPVPLKPWLWFISTGVIIAGVTLRHFICILTGNISGQKEVFREYLINIYQSYRVSSILIFFIIILILYTAFFRSSVFFFAGFLILGIIYIIRVMRLLIIFLNRNISIFYLILYLCALEILPVLILMKYFTGLI